jgi:hypothetical protein
MFSSCSPIAALAAAAGQITAHHGFHRDRLQALHQHRTTRDLGHLGRRDHALGRIAGEVDRADVQTLGAELVKPEERELREQLALAGNRLAHDHVKGADAVARHHQDAVVAHGVVVAHLAAREQGQGGEGRGVQGSGHDRIGKRRDKKKAR